MNARLFGTDGIRNRIGQEPFTASCLARLGYAIGIWLQEQYKTGCTILLAYDTRDSCDWVKNGLQIGLLHFPHHLIDSGILPTPALALAIQKDPTIDCGIMISASHNPYTDNGIKIITKQGKLTNADEQTITAFYAAGCTAYEKRGFVTQQSFAAFYTDYLHDYFNVPDLSHKKIVLDCAHGAAYRIAPALFRDSGASVIQMGHEPNGNNINDQCGAAHPDLLQKTVLANQADLGFGFDGDGDRLIVVAPDGSIKNGDDILALFSQHERYRTASTIVGTLMSNKGLETFLTAHQKNLIRADIGDKYVAQTLTHYGSLLGGEPSGHILMHDYQLTGDGLAAALALLEVITQTDNWQLKTFKKFPQITINVPVNHKKDLHQSPLCEIIATKQAALPLGRLLVRYSGTESVLRIMIEDEQEKNAYTIGKELATLLQQALA